MIPAWDDYRATMDGVVSGFYGEPFTFRPMIAGRNSGARPDPDRAVREKLICEFDDQAKSRDVLDGVRENRQTQPGRSTSNPLVYVEVSDLQGDAVKSGDFFIREKDGARYRVSDAEPDGQGKIVCQVNLYIGVSPWA